MIVLPFRQERDLPKAAAAVQEALAKSGVVAMPTETFYGLGVNPRDPIALEQLNRLKGRDAGKAFPLVAASLEQVEEVVIIPELWRARLKSVWPAPLSVVLPTRPSWADFGPTAAVRVPAHPLLRALLTVTGPLTATSANLSGQPPAQSLEQIAMFASGLEVVLDGGTTPGELASTVLDLTTEPPRVLRAGAFPVPPQWLQV